MTDDIVARLRASRAQWTARAGIPSDLETEAADEIERLRARVQDLEQVEATAQLERLGIDMHSAFNAGREALIKGCREERLRAEKAEAEIERLRARIELLSGYLNGALNVIEGFVACDTAEARAALDEEKADD